MMNTYDLNTLFDKLRRLRLKAFLAALETLRDQEPERLAPFASQLENMVDQELAERTERTIARRIQEARFVRIQTVDAFDFGYTPASAKPILHARSAMPPANADNASSSSPAPPCSTASSPPTPPKTSSARSKTCYPPPCS
jgi:hypothetical protein